jgi:UDP-glucose 4-epimerase
VVFHEGEEMKYLITGGAGLVGSHIVDALIERGDEVVIYDNLLRGNTINPKATFVKGDIQYIGELMRAMEGCDGVFHQAALCLKDCEEDVYKAINNNIIGTVNVLEACKRQGVKKIVAASSSSVYGDGRYLPTDEDHPFDNYLFYGATKVANEQFYRAYYKKYGLDYVAFRYLNVYGPRMDSHGAYMMVIMHFLNSLKAGKQPVINGDGTATLDLVYVKDVVQANLMAMDSKVTNEVFNVASGKETTLNELLMTLEKLLGVDIQPIFQERDKTLVTHRLGCPKKAKELLGFECLTKLEKGLKEVIDDYETKTRVRG